MEVLEVISLSDPESFGKENICCSSLEGKEVPSHYVVATTDYNIVDCLVTDVDYHEDGDSEFVFDSILPELMKNVCS